jgi:trk system potassium uptake protein TrkH
MSNLSKLVLSFDMLAGRLELFPMLILFTPEIWTETFIAKKKNKVHRRLMAKKAMENAKHIC